MKRFWEWVDERAVVRRIVLFVTLWMTWRAFTWAAEFAHDSPRPGMDVAAIIAAVVAPISLLQSAVFKVYTDGKA